MRHSLSPARACRPSAAAAALAGGLLALLSLAGCGGEPTGVLLATPDSLDFGPVEHGRDVEKQVRLKNTADHALVLVAVKGSCACIVVPQDYQRSLAPGEETRLRVILHTGVVAAQKLVGKHVDVRSDDPSVPALQIPVYGEIETRLSWTPEEVHVDAADSAGRGEPKRIEIRTAGGYVAKLNPRGLEVTQPDWFDVRLVEVPNGYDALLSVKPDATRRGKVNEYVRLQFTVTGRGLPPQEYPVLVKIQGTW